MDCLDIELFDEFRTCLEIMIVDTQITCRGYSLFSILDFNSCKFVASSIISEITNDELCIFMEKDPKQRVAISCFTCIKGMDLSKQYGKPKHK